MHINKLNNKVYVGITGKKPNDRWENGRGYLRKRKNGNYYHPKFSKAILKYGWNNFEHIIFAEGLTHKEACNIERLLIAFWDTFRCGYNSTEGGEGSVGRHPTEETKRKISKSLTGTRNGAKHGNAKKIMQYTKDGVCVRVWDYLNQAKSETGISISHISECATGKRKSAGGYFWKFVE